MNDRRRIILMAMVSVSLGGLIWALSPSTVDQKEPWDANGLYYLISLFAAGILGGCVFPRRFWIAPIGIYVGQFWYAFIFLPGGPLWVVGLIFGLGYSAVSLAGAALVHVAWRIGNRIEHRTKRFT